MAELRCPMCSKLNPDTLEVCQFCGARLKPLVLPPTSALDIPGDWAKPKADDKPAGQKASSGDDWLSSLRSEDSSSSESPSTGNVDDWLAKLRQQDEAEDEAAAEAPASSPSRPAATPKPAGTDWLGALRASTDELPSWLAEPVEPTESQPEENWLSRLGGSGEETVVRGPQPQPADKRPEAANRQPEAANRQPEAESSLPPWLAEPSEPAAPQETDDTMYIAGPGTKPAADRSPEAETPAASEPSQVPDWLKSYGGSADETIVRRPAAAPEPASPESEIGLPDWLTGQPASSESSTSVPDWMRSSGPDETIAASPSDLPDWLKGDLPVQPTAPQPEPASSTPSNWLDSNQPAMPGTADDETISVSPEDIPDWLKDGEPAAPSAPPAAPEKPSSNDAVVGITDWFSSAESSPPKTGTSDWLKSKEPETPSDAPRSVVGVTDWLSSIPSQAPVNDNLDWLKPPETPAPPAEPVAEKAPPGTTDWLNSLGVTTPPKPSTKELKDRGTGWLSATPDAQQKSPDAQAARKPGTGQLKPGTGQLKPGTGQLKPGTGQLKPGTGGLKPDTGQLKPDTGGLKPDTGNLLARFKDTAPPSEMPSGSAPAITGLTGWLSSLQNQPSALPPPSTTPDESGKAVIGTTDWLNSLASDPKKTGAIKTGWLGSLPLEQSQPSSSDPEQQAKALFGATDWLSQLAASAPLTPPEAATPAAELPKAEIPDWLSQSAPAEPADKRPEAETPASGSSSSNKAVIGTTDWLRSLEANKGFDLSKPGTRKNDVSDLDWLNIGPSAPPAPAFATAPAPAPKEPEPTPSVSSGQSAPPFNTTVQTGELPTWLAALKPEGIEAVPSTGPLPPPAAPSAPPPPVESEPPATSAVTTEDLPEWMRPDAAQTTQTEKVAPLVSPIDETIVTRPPAAKPVPVPAFTTPVGPAADDLAVPNLPPWLNALRPLDARATSREPEPDHEEATGPLAGMRGVLPAESIISMAGRPGASVAGFLLTDQQTKLADNLRVLVKEEATEEAEIKPRKRARVNFSFSRLLVSVALLFIIIVPFALGPLLFPPPAISSGTNALYTQIEELPTDGPVVLLAVDYDPAFSGELNPAVNSVMVHLMKRGARVITVSTSPAGAGIAQKLLADSAFEADLANDDEGKRYLNLGYIPGNTAGLRQFATDPLHTIAADYYGNEKPFEREVLAGFEGFNNINMVIVATASADTLRNWIEQVGSEGQPMAAITSASVAPLAAPYTKGSKPQLSALVSGLSGALEYDTISQRTNDKADVLAREWSAFGLSLYASAGILVLGALASIVSVVMTRRPAQAKAAARPQAAAQPKPKATKRKAAPKIEETMPAAEPDFSTSAGAFDDLGTFSEPTYSSQPSAPQLETMVATPKKTKTAQNAKTTKTANTAKASATQQSTKPKSKSNGTADDTKTTKPKLRKV